MKGNVEENRGVLPEEEPDIGDSVEDFLSDYVTDSNNGSSEEDLSEYKKHLDKELYDWLEDLSLRRERPVATAGAEARLSMPLPENYEFEDINSMYFTEDTRFENTCEVGNVAVSQEIDASGEEMDAVKLTYLGDSDEEASIEEVAEVANRIFYHQRDSFRNSDRNEVLPEIEVPEFDMDIQGSDSDLYEEEDTGPYGLIY